MIGRILSRFASRFRGSGSVSVIGSSTISTGTSIVSQLSSMITQYTQFDQMTDAEVFEQLARFEPEIGGAIDRFASLVGAAYKGVQVKAGKTLEPDEERLLNLAQKIEQQLNIPQWFEVISELQMIHGNAFILVSWSRDSALPSLSVLPNDRVTVVDKRARIGQRNTTDVITEPRYVVLNEASVMDDQRVYRYGNDVLHFKFKKTPFYVTDLMGRPTYGIYSPSPLERAVMAVLWKREIMLIDATWRWRNVPREHHVISSELFDLSRYSGTIDEKRQAALEDAQTRIQEYMQEIRDKQPDQAYVTLDTTKIEVVEPKSSRYMSPNDIMEQISQYLWISLGVPESVVSGRSKGSYASELVVSSYLTAKVIQVAKSIKEQMLELVREIVRKINPQLPVEKLDMKIELIMDTNRMELFRQAAIMANLGVFTPTEIRKHLGYDQLTEGQWSEIAAIQSLRQSRMGRSPGSKTIADIIADVQKTIDDFQYPDTKHTEEKRKGLGVKKI